MFEPFISTQFIPCQEKGERKYLWWIQALQSTAWQNQDHYQLKEASSRHGSPETQLEQTSQLSQDQTIWFDSAGKWNFLPKLQLLYKIQNERMANLLFGWINYQICKIRNCRNWHNFNRRHLKYFWNCTN